MNECVNICLCQNICIKNVQLQFLVKYTCVESVSGEVKQSHYLAVIFCVVHLTRRYELVKFLYFSFSVLGRVWFFPLWLKLFLLRIFLFYSISFHTIFPILKNLGVGIWDYNISDFFSVISVIDSSSTISVLDERLIKLLLIISATLSSINSVIDEMSVNHLWCSMRSLVILWMTDSFRV